MSKILGLDLGTNSIGWSIVDDQKKVIVDMGSRIFQEGVENLGEGDNEISKNASRTDARSTRRQFFRRRLRKRYLLRLLAQNNMCPFEFNRIKTWNPKDIFNDSNVREWFKLNPYELRAKAINEEISLEEIGRIFYHLIQRRGFLSNSRSAGKEEGKIYDGDAKAGKIGISETMEKISNASTLGSYLYSIYPQDNTAFEAKKEKIRNRYTTRQMYIDEFETIWNTQKEFHKELNQELKTILGGRKKDGYSKDGALFHQRPLRSQKHLVGNCTFEKGKTKSPSSAIPFELFRVYQWANTVECNGHKLEIDERDIIIQILLRKEKVLFSAIRKALNKLDGSYQFNYKDDDRIVGTHTISNLSNIKFFGGKWFEFSEKEQEDIWHVLYFFEDRDKLKQYAIDKWGFGTEKAEKVSKFSLKDKYSNLSRKAINNILPFLKMGFTYDLAVVLGGIRNAFGSSWANLKHSDRQLIYDNIQDIVRQGKIGGFMNELRTFLKSEYQLTDKQLGCLYHHSAAIKTTQLLDRLPVGKEADKEIQSIRNPIVTTALFEIRNLVNEIIGLYGIPDEIKIELARDLKISKTKRNDIAREQKRLERENDRIKDLLSEQSKRPTHINMLKFKLWEECDKTCPYTGRSISLEQLFSGEVQIEHIFPWSRSLNDSFMNKTLCFADENRAKGDQTPYEFYSKLGEEKWEQKKLQALSCFKNKFPHYPNAYQKFKQFIKTKHDADFISRQLNDTRYISKEAKNYLSKICNNVMVSPGQMTANLRHKWGLNSILNDENSKSREDHRHHAIDALVMACAKRSHLQELSKWNRYDRNVALKDFPMPWDGFWHDAEKSVGNILVSHKRKSSVLTFKSTKSKKKGKEYTNLGIAARGQLHKETVYGRRKAPNSQKAYHVRKPIENLTTVKQLGKVVDPVIQRLILKRIEEMGGSIKDKIPPGTFYVSSEDGNLIPQIFLPNKNGQPVPVKKVRMKENFSVAERLKGDINQYVNPRNNHHILIFRDELGNLHEDVVTFWRAVERKKQGISEVQLPDEHRAGTIVTTLQINDTFILKLHNEEIDWENTNPELISKHLYRVQKLSSKFFEFRLVSESKLDKNYEPYYVRIQSFGEGKTGWKTFNPIKVKITSTGKVQKI